MPSSHRISEGYRCHHATQKEGIRRSASLEVHHRVTTSVLETALVMCVCMT